MKAVVFRNVRRFQGGAWEPVDLTVSGGQIASIGPPGGTVCRRPDQVLDWPDACVLPGLINAHDHLELNLLPRLGDGPYGNSYEWSRDIYRPNDPPMRDVLALPLRARLLMGGYKNLLSGVTTVCHHNPYQSRVFNSRFPVRVIENYGWSHSLGFGDDLGESCRAAAPDTPWIIHAAEGVDARAAAEIRDLEARGLLADNTVIVHGVALNDAAISLLERRRASLVWCPSSNLFLFGATAPIDKLRDRVPVALGSDSTLSATGDLLDEVRVAASLNLWPPDRLAELVTTQPSRMLRLHDTRADLVPGGPADLLFVTAGASNPSEALLATRSHDIRLVVCRGVPAYGDPSVGTLFGAAGVRVSRITVDGLPKLVAGAFDELFGRVSSALGRTRFFNHEIAILRRD